MGDGPRESSDREYRALVRGHEVHLWHVWPDGTEKCLLVRAQSVDHGKRAIGVVIDITER